MSHTTLISTNEVSENLHNPDWAIIDCRFTVADPGLGERSYLQAHIPGAAYAHLERDLSSPVVPGVTGRHPWLSVEDATQLFSRLGIGPGVQVVAYDDAGGALAAARLWWMLRWLGHSAAAVLDGGWGKWLAEGRPATVGEESRPPRQFQPHLRSELLVDAAAVDAARQDPAYRVLDARAAERYHGQNETIDPVAGHIPGALSAPYQENLDTKGVFRPADELRQRYQALVGETPPERTIYYCGSGVTAIHDLLAMLHAGLGEGRLYAGSWSEWITDPSKPVAD